MKIMKKLLAMIVALSCIFCIFSCNSTDDDGNKTNAPSIPVSEGGVSFAEFVSAVEGMSSVKTSSIKTSYTTEGKGTLESVFSIAYNTDGSASMEFTTERYGSLANDEDFIVTEGPFVVECDKNGNYSLDGVASGNVMASGAYRLNLDQYKLYDARIEGNVLYATVFSTDTADVLGTQIVATVSLSVVINGGKITALSADYIINGSWVSVKCEYGF